MFSSIPVGSSFSPSSASAPVPLPQAAAASGSAVDPAVLAAAPWARSELAFLRALEAANRAATPVHMDENDLCREFDSEVVIIHAINGDW